MIGMNQNTGKKLTELEHLRQSIKDILTTPIGTRVMRRDYGSRIFDLIDRPLNSNVLLDIFAASAEAIAKWEPRFQLVSVSAFAGDPGHVLINIAGNFLPNAIPITIEGIVV